MEGAGIFLIVAAVIVIGVLIRLMAGGADHERIRAYVAERGGTVDSINWAPFGRGWFGEKSDRIYIVRYTDSSGDEHEASCKTSLFSGVYFTEDHIVSASRRTRDKDDPDALRAENERLRDELRRLRQGEDEDRE